MLLSLEILDYFVGVKNKVIKFSMKATVKNYSINERDRKEGVVLSTSFLFKNI